MGRRMLVSNRERNFNRMANSSLVGAGGGEIEMAC